MRRKLTTEERRALMELIEQREKDIIEIRKKSSEFARQGNYEMAHSLDVDCWSKGREIQEYRDELEYDDRRRAYETRRY